MAFPSMKQFGQEIKNLTAALAEGNGTAPPAAVKKVAPSSRAPGRSMNMSMQMGMKPS